MARQLPKVRIGETEFYTDIRLEEFRQVDNPHNVIQFCELIAEDDHYLLFIDTHTQNVFQGSALADAQTEHLKVVSVPSLWDIDPVGMENYLSEWIR